MHFAKGNCMKKMYGALALLFSISSITFPMEMKKGRIKMVNKVVENNSFYEESICCKYCCMAGSATGYFIVATGTKHLLGSIPDKCDICFGCCPWAGSSFLVAWYGMVAVESMLVGGFLGKCAYDHHTKLKID
jgi:hypothetical protein